jgi:hypothetical protein
MFFALRLLLPDPDVLGGPDGDRRHRHLVDLVPVERAVLGWVGRVAGLLDVSWRERVLVQHEHTALRHDVQVCLQGRGVHRHEHVGMVARCGDVPGGELDLECRNPVDGARGGTDLGGEVRQRREVVAEHGRRAREAIAGQLHAVAGVAGEAHDDPVSFLDGLAHLDEHTTARVRL